MTASTPAQKPRDKAKEVAIQITNVMTLVAGVCVLVFDETAASELSGLLEEWLR